MKAKSKRYSDDSGRKKDILDFNNLSSEDTKRLNRIAREIAKGYTEFVDECSKKYGDDYLFWATPFASRNIYNDSDSYLSVCRIRLAIEAVNEGRINRINTAYISEREILKGALAGNISVSSTESFSTIDSIKRFLRHTQDDLTLLFRYTQHLLCTGKTDHNAYNTPISVAIVPVLSSEFDGYYYKDRYMTGITEYRKIVFLPLLNNNGNISEAGFIEKIKNCSNYDFMMFYSFLGISDLYEIIKYRRLCNRLNNNRFIYNQIDISPIIKRSLTAGKHNVTSYKGILIRKAIRRMKKAGISIDNALVWYEGRPSDVMAVSAIRETYPNAFCVGYEGFPVEDANIAHFVSSYQNASKHAPNVMAVPGQVYDRISRWFCDDVNIIYAPILRNEYNYRENRKNGRIRKALVVLPYFPGEVADIIKLIDEYTKDRNSEIIFLLKNHPVHIDYKIEDYGIKKVHFRYEFVEGNLDECLEMVDVAILTSTTSSLEVLYAGVSLISVFLRGRLGYTAIPKEIEDVFCHIVYDSDELSDALATCENGQNRDNSMLNNMLVSKNYGSVSGMFR